jgi:hypothetical protein
MSGELMRLRYICGFVLLLAGQLFAAGPELLRSTAIPPAGAAASRPAPAGPVAKPGQKYTTPSPEEVRILQEWVDSQQTKIEKDLKVKLARLDTAHFQILTDWDPQEYSFLKDNFEAAYSAVTTQFNIPEKENVFVGKLPCFVFTGFTPFKDFLQTFGMKGVVPDMQGIHVAMGYGMGFMAVHKPQADHGGKKTSEAMVMWKYVLTHEMTHAFVARYISDRHVVTWLNEGIAEVVASSRILHNVHLDAKYAASKYGSLDKLFADDGKFKAADMYPVMRTLVEVLIKRDHTAFMKMFDDIKNGKAPDTALMDNYHWTYAQLEAVWRQYIK